MNINITETVLRDGQQSLIATRMRSKDFEGILDSMDNAGYYSIECWGGATFDACIRFLNEDPWERLRMLKSKLKKTKLQMLLRGQNLLGYKHYSDDVVKKFIRLSVKNGIDIIRIFDALNDFSNMQVAIEETILCNCHAQGCIVYTKSPIHSIENYIEMGKELENLGVNSICIKDMAGIMLPNDAYELITRLKEIIKIPIFLHSHSTAGVATVTYLKAIEAGCCGIDTSISSFSGGAALPATESINYILNDLGFNTDLNRSELNKINSFFKKIRGNCIEDGSLSADILETRPEILTYQIPGGMLSNLISQLKDQNAEKLLDNVLKEIPLVRKELGYPPLVTPLSQIVGVQATLNVLLEERYKRVTNEVKSYLLGEYGKIPGAIDDNIKKKIFEDDSNYVASDFDKDKPIFEMTRYKLNNNISEEDVLTYILFPEYAEKFFEIREESYTIKAKYNIEVIENDLYSISKISNEEELKLKEVELIRVSPKEAALIIAILCEHLDCSVEELNFRYIKAI